MRTPESARLRRQCVGEINKNRGDLYLLLETSLGAFGKHHEFGMIDPR